MSQDYRGVIEDFFGGWSEEQRADIREKAVIELASRAGEAVYDDEANDFFERGTLEDYLDGKKTVETEQLKSAFKSYFGTPLDPERQLREAEEKYAEERADQFCEYSDVETSFHASDGAVDIELPDSSNFEVLENLQGLDGETTLRLQKEVTVDIGDEEEMREAAESEGTWKIDDILTSIQFSGGRIESELYSESLVIRATEYTEELEKVLDEFGL